MILYHTIDKEIVNCYCVCARLISVGVFLNTEILTDNVEAVMEQTKKKRSTEGWER